MPENTIYVKKYNSGDERFFIREREVWRYCGYRGVPEAGEENLKALFENVVEELKDAFSYQVCYRRMKIHWDGELPVLPFPSESGDLAKCLMGSEEIILFAATIGLGIDRQIAKNQRFSPTKALLMQGYGAERVEVLCDVFCDEIREFAAEEGLSCTPRYSPGYGDLPLEKQKDIFRLLDCSRQIGISLNESLLMTPSKSVTAIFGLGKCVGRAERTKCDACESKDCEFRNHNRRM